MTEETRTTSGVSVGAPTILVVEDDAGLNRLTQKSLARAGYQTAGAFSGDEALGAIDRIDDPLLLLDYRLPDMTGAEIVQRLGARGKTVPFIVMTGYGDERTAITMMKLGALDYIIKESHFTERLPHLVTKAVDAFASRRPVRAERARSHSEERYRKAFTTSTHALAISRLDDGRIIEVNQSFSEMSGCSQVEFLEARAVRLDAWLDENDCQTVEKELRMHGRVYGRKLGFRTEDRRHLTVLYSANIICIDARICVLSSIIDVTTPREVSPSAQPRRNGIVKGSGVVLIADHEADVRQSTATLVTSFGYRAVAVDDGQAAVEYFSAHRTGISAVVLDLVMPRLGGVACLREIRRMSPDVNVVVAAASGEGDDAKTVMVDGASAFLEKPYSAADLSQALAATMKKT